MKQIKLLDVIKPEELTVDKVWAVVSALLFKGHESSQVQRDEMRLAFYVGFTECFSIMSALSDEMEEDQAASVLSRLNDECLSFHEAELARMTPPGGSA